jgi:ribosomal protein S18 acetylase RimI-like enzyme
MLTDTPRLAATDADLAAAVEGNLHALFRYITDVLPGAELVEGPHFNHHHAFPTNPMFKGVWSTRLPPEAVDAAIDETVAWYRARGASFMFWWHTGLTQPADLGARLEAHGFQQFSEADPGLAADLNDLPHMPATPPGFSIVRAHDQRTLDDWRDAFIAAFELAHVPMAGQAWVDATLAAGPATAPWQLYVGYLDGQPVATNILVLGDGVAGLYAVGTVPAARRQGIGALITLQPLLDARAQGYRYGVLFATEMGLPMYKRLGYREVDSRIGRHLLFL